MDVPRTSRSKEIERFLLANGASLFVNNYLNRFYSNIDSNDENNRIKIIITPVDVAIDRLVKVANLSIEQIANINPGLDILANHISIDKPNMASPLFCTATNGRKLFNKLMDTASVLNRLITPDLYVLVINGVIYLDNQLGDLKNYSGDLGNETRGNVNLEKEETTLDLLNRLFNTDPRLMRTKPTKEYHVDQQKLQEWKSLAEPYLVDQMRYVEYHFNDWLASLAQAIDLLISEMNHSDCDFLISNGKIEDGEQSSSELWMNYIFNNVMQHRGYIIETYDDYWNRIKKNDNISRCINIVILDDFIRTGMHITQRILRTPRLKDLLKDPTVNIYIVSPIIVTPEFFRENFVAIVGDSIYENDNDTQEQRDYVQLLTSAFTTRTHFLTGIVYDIDKYPYIVLDHNGSDKYESEISRGFIGIKNGRSLFMGSLLEGADPNNPYRYPPPLYHLEFGDGTLPLAKVPY